MTYPQLLKLLRQLLSQSRPAWEITKERKAAMHAAMLEFGAPNSWIEETRLKILGVFSAMLAEAEGKP